MGKWRLNMNKFIEIGRYFSHKRRLKGTQYTYLEVFADAVDSIGVIRPFFHLIDFVPCLLDEGFSN